MATTCAMCGSGYEPWTCLACARLVGGKRRVCARCLWPRDTIEHALARGRFCEGCAAWEAAPWRAVDVHRAVRGGEIPADEAPRWLDVLAAGLVVRPVARARAALLTCPARQTLATVVALGLGVPTATAGGQAGWLVRWPHRLTEAT